MQGDIHMSQRGALHQFLQDPYIKERNVCSCIYILDPAETMTPQEYEESYIGSDDEAEDEPEEETEEWRRAQDEKRVRMDQFARLDAIPYLCNGFYQDEKVAHLGGGETRHSS